MYCIRHSRKNFGLFEKQKDYVEWAKAYHKEEATLDVMFERLITPLFFNIVIISAVC